MITYEQIVEANKQIGTTSIKGKEYAEVNQRVKAFRSVCPDGAITTEVIKAEGEIIVMKATITDGAGKIISTGLAYEKESSSYINKTSYIENCETSAVGRALGFAGFGIDTSICSEEELTNAVHQQEVVEDKPKGKRLEETAIDKTQAKTLKDLIELTNTDEKKLLSTYKAATIEALTIAQWTQAVKILSERKERQTEDVEKILLT